MCIRDSLIYCFVHKKKIIETIVTIFLLGSVIFLVSAWMTSVYKMGAGYCLKTGRQMTYLGALAAISEFESARLAESDGYVVKPDVSVEQLAKSALHKVVELYEINQYEEAIENLPAIVGYPAGQVKWAEDIGWQRMYRGNAFKQISVDGFYGSSKKISYYVSNCGEVKHVYPIGYD